jgi:hypothetical protein
MDKEDRQKLMDNMEALVNQIYLAALIPELLLMGGLTLQMAEKYMVSYIQQFFFVCVAAIPLCLAPLVSHFPLLPYWSPSLLVLA